MFLDQPVIPENSEKKIRMYETASKNLRTSRPFNCNLFIKPYKIGQNTFYCYFVHSAEKSSSQAAVIFSKKINTNVYKLQKG